MHQIFTHDQAIGIVQKGLTNVEVQDDKLFHPVIVFCLWSEGREVRIL